jgi:hypothetical protein
MGKMQRARVFCCIACSISNRDPNDELIEERFASLRHDKAVLFYGLERTEYKMEGEGSSSG